MGLMLLLYVSATYCIPRTVLAYDNGRRRTPGARAAAPHYRLRHDAPTFYSRRSIPTYLLTRAFAERTPLPGTTRGIERPVGLRESGKSIGMAHFALYIVTRWRLAGVCVASDISETTCALKIAYRPYDVAPLHLRLRFFPQHFTLLLAFAHGDWLSLTSTALYIWAGEPGIKRRRGCTFSHY